MEPEILDHIEDKEAQRNSTTGIEGSSSAEEDGNSRIHSNGFERPRTSGQESEDIINHEQPIRGEISDDHVIDVDHDSNSGDCIDDKICRICHLGAEPSSGASGLMQLGCHCKAELGICHPRCAETWFKHKGNSICEICGVRAKNVKFVKNYNSRMLIVDFDDIRPITGITPYPSPEEGSRRCKQSCCNFLLASLVLGLVVPWFLRTHFF